MISKKSQTDHIHSWRFLETRSGRRAFICNQPECEVVQQYTRYLHGKLAQCADPMCENLFLISEEQFRKDYVYCPYHNTYLSDSEQSFELKKYQEWLSQYPHYRNLTTYFLWKLPGDEKTPTKSVVQEINETIKEAEEGQITALSSSFSVELKEVEQAIQGVKEKLSGEHLGCDDKDSGGNI